MSGGNFLTDLASILVAISAGTVLKTIVDAIFSRRKRVAEARADDIRADTDEIANLRTVLDDLTARHLALSERFDALFAQFTRLQQDYLNTRTAASSMEIELERMRDEAAQLREERQELLGSISDLAARVAQLEAEVNRARDDAARMRVILVTNGLNPETGQRVRGGL